MLYLARRIVCWFVFCNIKYQEVFCFPWFVCHRMSSLLRTFLCCWSSNFVNSACACSVILSTVVLALVRVSSKKLQDWYFVIGNDLSVTPPIPRSRLTLASCGHVCLYIWTDIYRTAQLFYRDWIQCLRRHCYPISSTDIKQRNRQIPYSMELVNTMNNFDD